MVKKKSEAKMEREIMFSREAYLNALRERYSKYGDRLINFLFEKSYEPGGLRHVLRRVLRPLPHDDELMHQALLRFLSTNGADTFFARIETGDQASATPAPDLDLDEDRPDSNRVTVDGYRPKIISPKMTSPASRPSWEQLVHPQSVAKSEAAPPEAAPTGVAPPADAVAQAKPQAERVRSEGPWDGTEWRSGVDRRAGRERRSGRDRRQRVETVFRNRRFGLDRRSGIQRRSSKERRGNPPPHRVPM